MKQFISGKTNAAVTYNPWLMGAFKLGSLHQESYPLEQEVLFYTDLVYTCNKEDEFDKTLYQDELDDNEEEDDFNAEEDALLNYREGEGYEYDYDRHK